MDALMQDKLRLAGKVQSGVLLYAHPNARRDFRVQAVGLGPLGLSRANSFF